MAILAPTTRTLSAEGYAELYFAHVYPRFGLALTMVTDRDTLFTSKYWTRLAQLVGMRHLMSTAVHQQTDGQSEAVVKAMTQYLRTYVNYAQREWAALLPQAEFCYNATTHAATCEGLVPRLRWESVQY
jgi:transposase InsO family protein